MIDAQSSVASSTAYWLLAAASAHCSLAPKTPLTPLVLGLGMGEVWARYGPSHNSFLIKYGGMAYLGEGQGADSRVIIVRPSRGLWVKNIGMVV
jgi:hypothetical protein